MQLFQHWSFRKGRLRKGRPRLAAAAACCALLAAPSLLLTGCGVQLNGVSASTTVSPMAGEDFLGPCQFDVRIYDPHVPQRGVLVIYERGDSGDLFNDFDLEELAAKDSLATVLAHECFTADYNDIQPDGRKGPTRALFTALTQLATKTNHPELSNANLILYGFSAGGILAATTSNSNPGRVLGAILYAAGSAYVNIDDLQPPDAALRIPTLVIANAKDESSGTLRSYTYFEKARSAGAIWGFAVQNGRSHCCNTSTKPLILPWIDAVVRLRTSGPASALQSQTTAPLQINPSAGVLGNFICSPNSTQDPFGQSDCSFTSASIAPSGTQGSPQTAWLPDAATANAWLTWVQKHNSD